MRSPIIPKSVCDVAKTNLPIGRFSKLTWTSSLRLIFSFYHLFDGANSWIYTCCNFLHVFTSKLMFPTQGINNSSTQKLTLSWYFQQINKVLSHWTTWNIVALDYNLVHALKTIILRLLTMSSYGLCLIIFTS